MTVSHHDILHSMIYLIGGTPRVGKTTLSKIILQRKGIPFIPADVLTHALDHAYPQFEVRKGGWEKIPDRFFPYLRRFVESLTFSLSDYVVEGDSFFPEHVSKLSKEFKVKSIFLGTSDIKLEDILAYSAHDNWVRDKSREEQEALPNGLVEMSKMFKLEAEKYQIPYVDMAIDREKRLEEAYTHLFGESS